MRKGWKLEKLFDVGRAHHELYLACLAPTPPTAKKQIQTRIKEIRVIQSVGMERE